MYSLQNSFNDKEQVFGCIYVCHQVNVTSRLCVLTLHCALLRMALARDAFKGGATQTSKLPHQKPQTRIYYGCVQTTTKAHR